jgi:16S rRNA processing protein RimM
VNTVSEWVIVGRFGRPHGIKGFVTVHSFTEPRENILRYTDWHAMIQNQRQPLKLLHVEVQVKSIIAQVQGYDERDLAAKLTNIDITIPASQLPALPSGEYYWHELVGMEVVNAQGIIFGKVTEVMPTGSNDVLVVQGDKRILIPYLRDQFVLNIDDSKKVITVDWDLDF